MLEPSDLMCHNEMMFFLTRARTLSEYIMHLFLLKGNQQIILGLFFATIKGAERVDPGFCEGVAAIYQIFSKKTRKSHVTGCTGPGAYCDRSCHKKSQRHPVLGLHNSFIDCPTIC